MKTFFDTRETFMKIICKLIIIHDFGRFSLKLRNFQKNQSGTSETLYFSEVYGEQKSPLNSETFLLISKDYVFLDFHQMVLLTKETFSKF